MSDENYNYQGNRSGIAPVEYKCVVLPDEPPAKSKEGMLYIPETVRDIQKHRAVKALLVAVGGNAFEDWAGLIPKPGDRVCIAVAAGAIHKGLDEKEYRLINDKDIVGVLIEE